MSEHFTRCHFHLGAHRAGFLGATVNGRYKLVGHEAVLVEDLIEWAVWLQTAERRVAFDEITPDVKVSTVFLGLDHRIGQGPPLLFETMIFGGEHNDFEERYSTWEEAEAGHKRAVAMVQL